MFSGFGDNVSSGLTIQEQIADFLHKSFGLNKSFTMNVIEHLNPEMLEKNAQFATDLVLTVCNGAKNEANWNNMDMGAKKGLVSASAASLLLDGSKFQDHLRINAIDAMAARQRPEFANDVGQAVDDMTMPAAPKPDF